MQKQRPKWALEAKIAPFLQFFNNEIFSKNILLTEDYNFQKHITNVFTLMPNGTTSEQDVKSQLGKANAYLRKQQENPIAQFALMYLYLVRLPKITQQPLDQKLIESGNKIAKKLKKMGQPLGFYFLAAVTRDLDLKTAKQFLHLALSMQYPEIETNDALLTSLLKYFDQIENKVNMFLRWCIILRDTPPHIIHKLINSNSKLLGKILYHTDNDGFLAHIKPSFFYREEKLDCHIFYCCVVNLPQLLTLSKISAKPLNKIIDALDTIEIKALAQACLDSESYKQNKPLHQIFSQIKNKEVNSVIDELNKIKKNMVNEQHETKLLTSSLTQIKLLKCVIANIRFAHISEDYRYCHIFNNLDNVLKLLQTNTDVFIQIAHCVAFDRDLLDDIKASEINAVQVESVLQKSDISMLIKLKYSALVNKDKADHLPTLNAMWNRTFQ